VHVPVWHERTKAARAAGELLLIGITEEQHPDRCALYAQWQAFDWPILWDPFNLTASSAVPIAIAIDEHGIVRSVRQSLDGLDEFLASKAAPLSDSTAPKALVAEGIAGARELESGAVLEPEQALARLLWFEKLHAAPLGSRDFELCIASLSRAADLPDATPAAAFQLGVALRLRCDSAHARTADFQGSLDQWHKALALDPTQYIWRRRIQQWGPRLDKPYPFYGWIEQAQTELKQRGVTPLAVRVALTSSEIAGKEAPSVAFGTRAHPDPERKVERDLSGWIQLQSAVAAHTADRGGAKKPRSAQVHLALAPTRAKDVHWSNDAGPTEIWLENPSEFGLAETGLVLPLPAASESSAEVRRVDFTISAPAKLRSLRGTAFYFVCEGQSGECRYLAQDFEIPIN
jgi:hypothetical protein